MTESNNISELIFRYLAGTITDNERIVLQQWRDASADNAATFDKLTNMQFLHDEYLRRKAVNHSRAYRQMQERIAVATPRPKLMPQRSRHWMSIAAMLLLVVATGLLAFWLRPSAGDDTKAVHDIAFGDFAPGETRAVLTYANGEEVTLDAATPMPSTRPTVQVTQPTTPASSPSQPLTQNYTLSIPRGGEFKVILEDSTEVWLNAATTLVYPETFAQNERRVKVEGEAYFKVTRDTQRPFIVETAGQLIRVYGTEFNINGYDDDPVIQTTLVTGSIGLARADGAGGTTLLSPSHQSLFVKESGEASIRTVSPEVVTSWINGTFVFEDMTLRQIMRTLSRWYNFEYEFENDAVAETLFMGTVPRYGDFSYVVDIIQKSGGIHFGQRDGKVIIMTAAK